MTFRRAAWLIVLAVVIVAAAVLMSVPKFANTREAAYRAQERVAQRTATAADYAAPAPGGGESASPLRLPSVGELLAEVPADSTRLLIRTGEMGIEVDSLEPAAAAVTQVARAVGGFVANTSTFTTDAQRSATIELKIPTARFDAAVARLREIGEVQSLTVSVEDVGEEYMDVSARMANSQRLEARLLGLLATRTGRLEDVLQVEREMARVREEIERFQGRLQFLRQHAALSTLSVRLYEPGTIVGSQLGAGVIADAFRQAWRNFIWLVAFLVQALGVVLPLGALAFGGWWVWKRLQKGEA